MSSTSLRAVLTGDLVRSRRQSAPNREKLSEHIKAAFRRTRRRFSDVIPHGVSIFRGDGWQLYVDEPGRVLAVAVLFRAALRVEAGLDTRIGMALGTVETVEAENIAESTGPAFQRSGQALDELPDEQRMWCLLPEGVEPVFQIAADTLTDFADYIAIGWTDAQAQAVTLRLQLATSSESPSQRELAAHWIPEPITQQAVSKHLKHGAWDRVQTVLARFEDLAAHLQDAPASTYHD